MKTADKPQRKYNYVSCPRCSSTAITTGGTCQLCGFKVFVEKAMKLQDEFSLFFSKPLVDVIMPISAELAAELGKRFEYCVYKLKLVEAIPGSGLMVPLYVSSCNQEKKVSGSREERAPEWCPLCGRRVSYAD